MSLNKVMLIGNVGADPEIRYTDSGICTARIRLATSTRGYTLAGGTTVPERTEWHTVLLWDGPAKVAERFVHKGDKLYVEGELRYRNYTDRKGVTHYVTEIWCNNMEMLSPRPAGAAPAPGAPTASTTAPASPSATADNGGFAPPSN